MRTRLYIVRVYIMLHVLCVHTHVRVRINIILHVPTYTLVGTWFSSIVTLNYICRIYLHAAAVASSGGVTGVWRDQIDWSWMPFLLFFFALVFRTYSNILNYAFDL